METRHPDVCAVIIDEANNRLIEVRKNVLINQITRDAERIAKSFDELCAGDLERISEQFALCYALLTSGALNAARDKDELRIACGELLSNSLNSLAAATHMLRGGFVLQPGSVIRSCYESLAVVLHLIQFQQDISSHRNHTFDSTRAIGSAKKVFPPFGKMYGLLSKEFTHIGKPHKQFTPIGEYTSSSEPLSLNLQFIATGVWMSYVVCELTYLDAVERPRYWSKEPTESSDKISCRYRPTLEERLWMDKFLSTSSTP